jgi:Ni,Fe-hydrogenase III large subunit/Ni,Fe-hydrogenase III component G
MTPARLPSILEGTPGISGFTLASGVWRTAVDAARLPEVFDRVLRLGFSIHLVAGEDRRLQTGRIHVHYLCGRRTTHELLHMDVAISGEAPEIPTLAALSFPASRFERELRDQLGIVPAGHPDPRPLVRHGIWPEGFHPLRHDAAAPAIGSAAQPFPFTAVQGDGVYEIPVGPVHAGVIEPGHFRFNVLGETILKMRARLYFTHKGTERLFAGKDVRDAVALAERISGDTSVGHAVAYCQAVESLAGVQVPMAASAARVALLELERLYNHVGDVGAILADTGYAIGQSHALRIRESLFRLNKQLTGHRLLRGIVMPGGVAAMPDVRACLPGLRKLVVDFREVVDIGLANTLVADRLEETGRLAPEVAHDFGLVGYVARACGIGDDIRADFPDAGYASLRVQPVVETGGDVKARMLVRVREAEMSLDLIERAAATAGTREATTAADLGTLPPFVMGFGIVEGWRGRLVHAVMAGDDGRLHRVKVVDPSFFNWPALARALEDNIVPDFPLCNKSFNQSYSGNDL